MPSIHNLRAFSRFLTGAGGRAFVTPKGCSAITGFRSLSNVSRSSWFSSPALLTPSQRIAGMGIQRRMASTKSDEEMAQFLDEEIASERSSLKANSKAVQVKGFDVNTKEAEVTLTRKFGDEQIKIVVNVNHAVDADEGDEDVEQKQPASEPAPKMVCRPDFHIEITKGDSKLAFNCSIITTDPEENMTLRDAEGGEYQDLFNIEEFSVFKGEYTDNTYVIAGEVMDGSFYDNLMNMLDERGVNSEFVQQLIDFCTLYEQKLYVNLLEDLHRLVKSK